MIPRSLYKCTNCEHTLQAAGWSAAQKAGCPCDNSDIRPIPQNERGTTMGGTKHTWVDGKKIYQLNPTNPDYVVTSEKQMIQAYERNGISMDTGGYKSKQDSNYAALHHTAASRLKAKRNGS